MRALLPWVGLLGLLLACDDEARAKERAEAEQIVQAVRALRALDSQTKGGGLQRLKERPCGTPKLCTLRDVCAEAYGLHQRGEAVTRALSAELARDAAVDGAAAQLLLAEKDLAQARTQTRRCADLEGEAVREHGLN